MTSDSHRIRTLTWNVHKFIGRRRRRNRRATLDSVRELDADIVALQEIDARRRRAGEPDAFTILGEVFEPHRAEARTICSSAGDYGHVLMSHWPIVDSLCIDLSVRRRECRMAISCRIESPAGPIRVLAAHLGLSAFERRHQLRVIRDHLDQAAERPAIVLGDFNEWRGVGIANRALCPPFQVAAAAPSFPARRPLFALDRIWCRAPLKPLRSMVVANCRDLSDHLPVVADLEFTAARPCSGTDFA